MNMSDILNGLMDAREKEEAKRVPTAAPDDVLAFTLKEAAARYVAHNPYKPGDLAVIRRGMAVRDEMMGRPVVVVEALREPLRVASDEPGSHMHYAKHDVRVLCEIEGRLVPFWVEAWMLEPYTGPIAQLN